MASRKSLSKASLSTREQIISGLDRLSGNVPSEMSPLPLYPEGLVELIRRFDEHRPDYQKATYKETELRREFLDPFLELLNWDVQNRKGKPEAYKDVVHEYALNVGGHARAPDYCLRIGGERKFFVEAKKPSVKIKEDGGSALQLRRYGWSAKLPLSILTNFDELAVYDTRIEPRAGDGPEVARLKYMTAKDYGPQWGTIWATFSNDALLSGSFARFVETTRDKRGTSQVDEAFLAEIEGWRDELARGIALRNSNLTHHELNVAVQMTIDRIVFLRICEDRGIETYGRLQTLQTGTEVYPRLVQFFLLADQRYNSGLFHFTKEGKRPGSPDTFTPALDVDDKPLKRLLGRLYYPESPYEFGFIPADILGQVYEQFLGKVIRLTPTHRAVVEDKPDVKKAGGVFYTPTFIVREIVRKTLGPITDGSSPEEVSNLRVLDPACGSGSFLIGAYQFLLDWHQAWYASNEPKKRKKEVFEGPGKTWMLTAEERKRILLNNIHGVDIDPQAVEVTKLSLLLKVLESTSPESIEKNQRLFHERALPDLDSNVRCGNSLLDYRHLGQTLLDDEARSRVNPFEWRKEFPKVFEDENPGFDAIIGNPPYIRVQTLTEWAPLEVELYKKHYLSASKGNYDIYAVFIERALSLLKTRGRLGFIVPHKFMNSKYGEPLRKLIAEGKNLEEMVHFGDKQVFHGATTYTSLLFLSRAGAESFRFARVSDLEQWKLSGKAEAAVFEASVLKPEEWNLTVGEGTDLHTKLAALPVKLRDVTERIYQGPITSADTVYLFKEYKGLDSPKVQVYSKELAEWVEIERDLLKPVVRSGSAGRFWAVPTALVLFPYKLASTTATLLTESELKARFPSGWAYLNRNKSLLQNREKGAFHDRDWYRFGRTQNLGLWEQPKILIPYMITDLCAYFDEGDGLYFINVTTGGYGITVVRDRIDAKYLCGLLNSTLLDFFLKRVSTTFHGGYFAANKQFVEQLPIRLIDPSKPRDRGLHAEVVELVDALTLLNKQLRQSKTDHDRMTLGRQIGATRERLDNLVFDLYGISEDEARFLRAAPKLP